ncbi:hypothetical protein Tco_0908866 [Tanacetum coccineum]|uniref:Uncharacterized protein n=1 Tax=Tanacetum coccineum TaxID=301880 RepID=A0ABQ5CRT5_9ASTR
MGKSNWILIFDFLIQAYSTSNRLSKGSYDSETDTGTVQMIMRGISSSTGLIRVNRSTPRLVETQMNDVSEEMVRLCALSTGLRSNDYDGSFGIWRALWCGRSGKGEFRVMKRTDMRGSVYYMLFLFPCNNMVSYPRDRNVRVPLITPRAEDYIPGTIHWIVEKSLGYDYIRWIWNKGIVREWMELVLESNQQCSSNEVRNPVKEILLKMNLPDHRSVLTDPEDQAKMEMETPRSSRVNSPPNAHT